MASVQDKSALLKELSLNKDESHAIGFSALQLVATGIGAALISVLLTLWLGGGSTTSESKPEKSLGTPAAAKGSATAAEASVAAVEAPVFANNEEVLNASGYITARRLATVSAETMGLITSVEVEEGMNVEKGQILATLDDSLARVNLKLAEARVVSLETSVASIETDLKEAERMLQRFSSLGADSFVSEAQLTRAQADADKLRALLAASRADIRTARLQVAQQQEMLDNHTIRAPFAGVVTVKNAQTGEIVAPAAAGGGFTRTGICTIVDMASLEIEVDVNEAYIGRVKPGQPVKANLDAYPNWDIPASVIAIIPTADRAKATVRVRIKIEASDERILPDMGVKVAFLKMS